LSPPSRFYMILWQIPRGLEVASVSSGCVVCAQVFPSETQRNRSGFIPSPPLDEVPLETPLAKFPKFLDWGPFSSAVIASSPPLGKGVRVTTSLAFPRYLWSVHPWPGNRVEARSLSSDHLDQLYNSMCFSLRVQNPALKKVDTALHARVTFLSAFYPSSGQLYFGLFG